MQRIAHTLELERIYGYEGSYQPQFRGSLLNPQINTIHKNSHVWYSLSFDPQVLHGLTTESPKLSHEFKPIQQLTTDSSLVR